MGAGTVSYHRTILNFDTIRKARAAASGTIALAANDKIQILTLPTGVIVKDVVVEVITAEGATLTADLGYSTAEDGTGGSANFFGANLDFNLAGWKAKLAVDRFSLEANPEYMYLTVKNAPTTAVIAICYTIIDYRDK
jgi:hypothetical protein